MEIRYNENTMKKIVAIGGGEIGRPGYPVETTKIDKDIINLTGKKNPKFLSHCFYSILLLTFFIYYFKIT